MRRALAVLAVAAALVAACDDSGTGAETTASTTTAAVETTEATTTTLPPECPPAPYEVGILPERVADTEVEPEDLAFDEFTSIPGTHSTMWVSEDGDLAVALIRGTLPPRDWPGDRGRVSIDGADGVAGPFEDGSWVVAWFEQLGDRCDQYTMVFYPPVEPAEVQATIESLDRTAG